MGDGKIVLIVDDAKRFDGHALFEPDTRCIALAIESPRWPICVRIRT